MKRAYEKDNVRETFRNTMCFSRTKFDLKIDNFW